MLSLATIILFFRHIDQVLGPTFGTLAALTTVFSLSVWDRDQQFPDKEGDKDEENEDDDGDYERRKKTDTILYIIEYIISILYLLYLQIKHFGANYCCLFYLSCF